MSTQTTNLGLTKPDGSEVVDVSVINSNYDIIDTKLRPIAHDAEWVYTDSATNTSGVGIWHNEYFPITIPAHTVCLVTGTLALHLSDTTTKRGFCHAMLSDSNTHHPLNYQITSTNTEDVVGNYMDFTNLTYSFADTTVGCGEVTRVFRNNTDADITKYFITSVNWYNATRMITIHRNIIGYA